MTSLERSLRSAIHRRNIAQTHRTLNPITRNGIHIHRNNNTLIDIASNDYLNLSDHPLLRQRSASWVEKYGTGSRASRLVNGTLDIHVQVEKKLAQFKGCDAALLFASGWQANASILPALCSLSRHETGYPARVFMDRLNHASLHHGCLSAGIRQIRFRHNDLAHLEEKLFQHKNEKGLSFIITESVFSMDGDRADLMGLRRLADQFNASLYVDEAHATGVLGWQGRGLAKGIADITMSTASKALGGMGAFVTGSQILCDYLLNHSSGFIYSTALPPSVLGSIDAALDIVPSLEEQRKKLDCYASSLRKHLNQSGWSTGHSSTHIIPIIVGDSASALTLAQNLEKEGFLATAIRPPTVPPNTARLRLALNAGLNESIIEHLSQVLLHYLSK